jgi:hypothetical protein
MVEVSAKKFEETIAGGVRRPDLYGHPGAWNKWYDEFTGMTVEISGLGIVKLEEKSTDTNSYGEYGQISMVFSVTDPVTEKIWYFLKTGYFSSYGSDHDWNDGVALVVPKPITQTEWVKL